jgi:hypothetical protein
MRFLMKALMVRLAPRLIDAFRQNLSGCAAVWMWPATSALGHLGLSAKNQQSSWTFW